MWLGPPHTSQFLLFACLLEAPDPCPDPLVDAPDPPELFWELPVVEVP